MLWPRLQSEAISSTSHLVYQPWSWGIVVNKHLSTSHHLKDFKLQTVWSFQCSGDRFGASKLWYPSVHTKRAGGCLSPWVEWVLIHPSLIVECFPQLQTHWRPLRNGWILLWGSGFIHNCGWCNEVMMKYNNSPTWKVLTIISVTSRGDVATISDRSFPEVWLLPAALPSITTR